MRWWFIRSEFIFGVDAIKFHTAAPKSGIYRHTDAGELVFQRDSTDRRDAGPDEAFVLRIMTTSEYAYHGADLAIVFLNTPLIGPDQKLAPTAADWIAATRRAFVTRPLTEDEETMVARYNNPGVSFKGIGGNE